MRTVSRRRLAAGVGAVVASVLLLPGSSSTSGADHVVSRARAEAPTLLNSAPGLGPDVPGDRAATARWTADALLHAGSSAAADGYHITGGAGSPPETAFGMPADVGAFAGRDPRQVAPRSPRAQDHGTTPRAHERAHERDPIVDGRSLQEVQPEEPRIVTSPEGWAVAGGDEPPVGSGGPTARYTVEIADGLDQRQDLAAFRDFVEATLSDTERGWTADDAHRLQRVESVADAEVRVVLASPETVDQLCAQAGLVTAGIYSCWNGRVAAINADRWFNGVEHVPDLTLYRTYLINHEVGHGLGYGHRACPDDGRLAPVMMQLSKSTYGCVPNGVPFP